MRKLTSWALALVLALTTPIFSAVASAEGTTTPPTTTTPTDPVTPPTTQPGTGTTPTDGHEDGEDHDDDGDHNDHDDGDKHDNGNGHKYGHDKEKKYENKYTGIARALESLLKVLEDGKGAASDQTIQAVIDKLTAMLKADGTAGSDQEAEDAVKEKIETDVNAGTATDESVEVLVTMQVNKQEVEAAQANVETALENKPSSDKLYELLTKVLKEKKDTEKVKVYVKGKKPVFDAAPYQKDDRSMVPVRAISEALGAKVDWNQEKQIVTIVKDGTTIEFPIGSKAIKVNGQAKTIDAATERVGDRTFVPVRFISEFLNQQVDWDQDTKTVIVK